MRHVPLYTSTLSPDVYDKELSANYWRKKNNRVDVDNGILWTWPECDVGFGFGWRSQEDWFYILLELSI